MSVDYCRLRSLGFLAPFGSEFEDPVAGVVPSPAAEEDWIDEEWTPLCRGLLGTRCSLPSLDPVVDRTPAFSLDPDFALSLLPRAGRLAGDVPPIPDEFPACDLRPRKLRAAGVFCEFGGSGGGILGGQTDAELISS